MIIPFTKEEVGQMILGALEAGYDPVAQVTDLTVHKGANIRHVVTLTLQCGSELKLTKEAVENAVVIAFNKDVAPVTVKTPLVQSITFHQSDSAMVKVDVVSKA